MDSISDGAALHPVNIGPRSSSAVAHAVASGVLGCKETTKKEKGLARVQVNFLSNRWLTIRKLLEFVFGGLLGMVNPRNPSVILAAVLAAMFLVHRAKKKTDEEEKTYRRIFWSKVMASAATYWEWLYAARIVDEHTDRKDEELYDKDLVQSKLNALRLRRVEGGVEDIVFFLRADLVRNLGNMCNPELHKGRIEMPRLILDYINEVRSQLYLVCATDSDEFSIERKMDFINETRHGFGRTALLLSGGASLGAFHIGVVRTLIDQNLLPRVVAGASVGSITCAFAATRTWSELQSFFSDPMPPMHFFESMGSIIATAQRLFTKGAVHEIGSLQRKMRELIGDLTFQEAYDLSARVLGISVCSPRKHEPPRCLNYLTSPHVVIWSAVTASCAFPGLFQAQELMAKDRHGRLVPHHSPTVEQAGEEGLNNMKRQWRDGSLESDLPMLQLKELFNVNHFIVSQANPHIAPLLRLKELTRVHGGPFAAKLAHIAEMELKHRCSQFLKMDFDLWGIAKLFVQEWEGDVTIVMPATPAQFAKIIQNPSPGELRKAVMQGHRCTWAKLSAIKANCGIELMLDECISYLHHRKKAQKDEEKLRKAEDTEQFKHGDSRLSGASTTKRIPSWNCLAHVGSWGSSEDGDEIEEQIEGGGPWGGPSVHKLKPAHGISDTDSESENIQSRHLSWTRVGGPLMKSASALEFVFSREACGDSAEYLHIATAPHDSEDTTYIATGAAPDDIGDSADMGSGSRHDSAPTRSTQVQNSDYRSSKQANKISSKDGCSTICIDQCEDIDYTTTQDGFCRQGSSKRS